MQTEIDTRMAFNPEGTILYVAVVCNRHCIYQVPYDAADTYFWESGSFCRRMG